MFHVEHRPCQGTRTTRRAVRGELESPDVQLLPVCVDASGLRLYCDDVGLRAVADPATWLALAQPYVLANGFAFCMLGPADRVPEAQGDLVLQRELAYRLPFSRAERRIAIYKRS